jgi:hypothetical protein
LSFLNYFWIPETLSKKSEDSSQIPSEEFVKVLPLLGAGFHPSAMRLLVELGTY